MSSIKRPDRNLVYGLLFPALVGLAVAGTVAQYQGVFDDTIAVTVDADRAGLTLDDGAPVKLHGVEIGRVGDISPAGDRVRVELDIDADQAGLVPSDVSAQIVPPTAFGGKYVQLTAPAEGDARPIAAGAVITADRVTVEVDEAFTNLAEVLDAARPASVDAALSGLAGAVDHRGELIGDLITLTDTYLSGLNPALPALSDDLHLADDVLDTYANAREDLVGALRHTGRISETLVQQQASLRAYEQSLTRFSDAASVLIRGSRHGIVTTLDLMAPVSRTLARYSPELPCLVLGLASANKLAEAAVGGAHPGVSTYTRLVPGRPAYRHPDNLPRVGDDTGPACYGLPYVTPSEAGHPPPVLGTGANPYAGPQSSPTQATLESLLGSYPTGATR